MLTDAGWSRKGNNNLTKRKDNKMLENTQNQTMESFMGSFGIVPMTTIKDEGLLSFKNCKDRILNNISQEKSVSYTLYYTMGTTC